MKKISKSEAQKQIQEFFKDIKNKNSKQIKKIKNFAMKNNFPLKELRKTFCKKCYSSYKTSKVRIKNGTKSVICENCRSVSRWKINSS